MTNSKDLHNPWMDILHVIRKDSFGFNIFIFIILILLVSILICLLIEKKHQSSATSTNDKKLHKIITFRRVLTGALMGFIFAATAGTAQFIIRFGYWTWFQEMGAIFTGVIGAVIGAIGGLINWRIKQGVT
jgi:small-conductance mechanosensitive channel